MSLLPHRQAYLTIDKNCLQALIANSLIANLGAKVTTAF
jgi:hypothetical protein